MEMLTPEMRQDLRVWNKTEAPTVPVKAREARALKTLKKSALSAPYGMRRALIHHYLSCDAFEMPRYPTAEDVVIASLECYKYDALGRGEQKQQQQRAAGEEVTGRGGSTATKPVRLGYANLFIKLGLSHFEGALTEAAKREARYGQGMPRVQKMVDLRALAAFETITVGDGWTEFQKAWAGAAWAKIVGSPRTINMQRTNKIHFERNEVPGEVQITGFGVARKSKAATQEAMKPLTWRFPVSPVWPEEVDLRPWRSSMEACGEKGGCFRAFTVPEGVNYSIMSATGWADRVATHQEVVQGQQDLLVMAGELDIAEIEAMKGHDSRHAMAELGRALEHA